MEEKNQTLNIEDFDDTNTYYYILDRVQLCSTIVFMSIGIAGNLISLFIFTRPSLNCKTNTGLLYALLCLLNLIAILYEVVAKKLDKFVDFVFYLPLHAEYFVEIILQQSMSWSQVIITFDRFLVVLYPTSRFMSKKWILYSIVLGVFAFILCVNSPYFIQTSSTYMMDNNQTMTIDAMSQEVFILTENVNIFMRVFIPYVVMTILDIMVIVRLRKSKAVLLGERQQQQQQHHQQAATIKSSRFTRNTILIDVIYLIFNLPSTIFNIYYLVIYTVPNLARSPPSYVIEIVVQSLTLLPYIYASLLFLLFVASNRIFRCEFIVMIRIIQKWLNIIKNNLLEFFLSMLY